MRISAPHTERFSYRRASAFVLAAVYLLIVFSPLASLAMQSDRIAHAVTGECTGDCNTCGCSMESRANHTCCCARKKMKEQHPELVQPEADEPECCRKIREESADADSHDRQEPSRTETVLKCGCPCDGGPHFTLGTVGSSEIIPYYYSGRIAVPYHDTCYTDRSYSAVSRYADPPDPPPRQLASL